MEGINRAGQLESTCDNCAMIPDGSQALGTNEMDPALPQFTTNSNGLGARHNADQCFACHSQPTLGGSGGFLVPNPVQVSQGTPPAPPENPQFNLIPHRFGKLNQVPRFEEQLGPIREVRFVYKVNANGDFMRTPPAISSPTEAFTSSGQSRALPAIQQLQTAPFRNRTSISRWPTTISLSAYRPKCSAWD